MTDSTSNPGEVELMRRIEALTAQCESLRKELAASEAALVAEQDAQYTAYRQLVELERVRAFDDIARGIEHELYNALTPVEGFTELLLMSPEQLADVAKARDYLETIQAAAEDAKNTVPRLREFYYSTNAIDFEQHESVSQMLSKALTSELAGEPEEVEEEDEFGTQSLSPREWNVLKLLSDGLKNREIAAMLSVSENTVKTHIKAILSKLSVGNRTQAAAYALLDNQAFEVAG
jgi:ATP/maltotriose-dependent transcriptional regulator MalT